MGIVYPAEKDGVRLTELLRGLGSYIAAHLSGPRCSKSIKGLEQSNKGSRSRLGVEFNAIAAQWNRAGNDVSLIEPEQMKPERDAGQWNDADFWESPRARRVMGDLRWLNLGNRDLPGESRFWSIEERQSTERTGRYQELQKRIEGWSTAQEPSELDHFWMQSHTLQSMAQLVPLGPARDLAIRRWLTHFEQGYRPGAVQNAWFGILRYALPGARTVNKKADDDAALSEMLRSRNPVVAAYAQWAVLFAQVTQ